MCVCLCVTKITPIVTFALFFFLQKVKNLSHLKRNNCIHLFMMIINSALKERTLIGNPSWCGVGTLKSACQRNECSNFSEHTHTPCLFFFFL